VSRSRSSPWRASRRDGEGALDTFGLSRVDHDDLRGVSDVHIEVLRLSIEHCPPGPTEHGNLGSHRSFIDGDNGERVRPGYDRITYVGDEDLPAGMVVSEAVGAHADGYL